MIVKVCTTDTNASTPPERCSSLPLTPPATDDRITTIDPDIERAKALLQSCQNPPRFIDPLLRLSLDPLQYQRLVRQLEQTSSFQSIDATVRFDYDPGSSVLEIRMPTPVHEIVSTSVASIISKQLQQIAEDGGATGNFARKIFNVGSSRVLLDGVSSDKTSVRRQPDVQFQHEDAAYPGLVVEISYSQDGKELDKLAWQYIQGSNGDIKAIIGIDINPIGKASTISLWRAHCYRERGDDIDTLTVNRIVQAEPFRSLDGTCENGPKGLRMLLTDFATDEVCEKMKPTALTISYSQLAELVLRAEKIQRKREQPSAIGAKTKQALKKRKRSSSSVDEMHPEDEARFREYETSAIDKVAARDTDFQPNGKC